MPHEEHLNNNQQQYENDLNDYNTQAHHQQQPQKQYYQKQQQHNKYNQKPQQQKQHSVEIIASSPRPFYQPYNNEQNYITYLRPQNFVSFIKPSESYKHQQPTSPVPSPAVIHSTTPPPPTPPPTPTTPTLSHQQQNVLYKINRPTPTNQILIDDHDHGYGPVQYRSKEQYNNVNYNKQVYPSQYDYSYTLDPNDGYGVRVPTHKEQIVQINARPHLYTPSKSHGYTGKPTYVSSTAAAPIVAIPTPFRQHSHQEPKFNVEPELEPAISYEHVAANAEYRPSTPPSSRQHLTETTQIQPPAVSTYHPIVHHPQSNENEYPQSTAKNSVKHTQYEEDDDYEIQPTPKKEYNVIIEKPGNIIVPEEEENETSQEAQYQHEKYNIPHSHNDHQQQQQQLSSSSLSDVLRKLQKTNLLPQTLNADNIDDSIKTLVEILNNLKQSQHVAEIPSQHVTETSINHHPQHIADYDEDNIDYNNEPDKPTQSGKLNHISILIIDMTTLPIII